MLVSNQSNENQLKISLQELRNSIDVEKTEWINQYSTNCYAHALGLDIPQFEIKDFAYIPGHISNSRTDLLSFAYFSYDDLINNMYSDFNYLDIEFREIHPLDELDYHEWKIALFIMWSGKLVEDYHFLRQYHDGIWYYKNGFPGDISKYDNYGQIIKNPEESFFRYYKYDKCLALKLK